MPTNGSPYSTHGTGPASGTDGGIRMWPYLLLILLVWTAAVAASLLWNLHRHRDETVRQATLMARVTLERDCDQHYLHIDKESLYQPTAEELDGTAPAPKIAGPEFTRSQVRAQVRAFGNQNRSIQSRLVGPTSIGNEFEARGYEALRRGDSDFSLVQSIDGEDYLASMLPLTVDESCQSCHIETLGESGQVVGAMSTRVPLGAYEESGSHHLNSMYHGHLLLWLLGVIGAFGAFTHVGMRLHERQRVENQLRDSEERFRTAFQTGPDASFVSRLDDCRLLAVNDGFERLTGISRERAVGQTLQELGVWYNERDRERFRSTLLAEGSVTNMELHWNGQDRSSTFVLMSATTISFADEIHILALARDVTAYRVTKDRLATLNKCLVAFGPDTIANVNSLTSLCGSMLGASIAFYNRIEDDEVTTLGSWTSPFERITFSPSGGEICRDMLSRNDHGVYQLRHLQTSEYAIHNSQLRESGLQTYVGVPVRAGGRKVGAMCILFTQDVDLSEDDEHILSLLAAAIGVEEERGRAERATRESEHKYRSYVDSAPDGVFVIDNDGIIIDANEAGLAITGFRRNELIGRAALDTVTESSAEVGAQFFEMLAATGRASCEIEVYRSDRSRFWISIHATRLSDTTFLSYCRDVTERRRAEDDLRQFKAAADGAAYAVGIVDLQERFVYVNKAGAALYGMTPEQMIGHRPDEAVIDTEFDIEGINRCREILYRDGRVASYMLHHRKKDGTPLPLLFSAVLIRDDKGEPSAIVYTEVDMRQHFSQTEQLRRLSAAVDQSTTAVCSTDPAGSIDYVNPAFCIATGYDAEDVVGQIYPELFPIGQDGPDGGTVWERVRAGESWSGRVERRRKDGESYLERMTISPIHDTKGAIASFLIVSDDITVEQQAQQKLAESDKLSAVGTLAAGVAHEFKNYLAGIVGNATYALDAMQDDDAGNLAEETLQQIVELGERANEVAMSLLSYSKAKPEDVTREDIREIVRKSVRLVEKEMLTLGIELTTYFEDVPKLVISPSKIQQMLLNLLINAQHAIGKNGVITVVVVQDGQNVKLKVADSGKGIDRHNLSRVFDPFFSTKGVWGKDEVVGTGMGLSICRNIVREHGGELTVESIVDVGTTFTASFPLPESERSSPGRTSGNSGKRLLMLSMDRELRRSMFEEAERVRIPIMFIEEVLSIPQDLGEVCDAVIIDAAYFAKVEMLRLVESCVRLGLPYFMVNCGTKEHELAEMFESASANFKQMPTLGELLDRLGQTTVEAT